MRRTFPLDPAGTQRLEIETSILDGRFVVRVAGKEVLRCNRVALREGVEVVLDDGSVVEIRDDGSVFGYEIRRDGVAVGVERNDSVTRIRSAAFVIATYAPLSIVNALAGGHFPGASFQAQLATIVRGLLAVPIAVMLHRLDRRALLLAVGLFLVVDPLLARFGLVVDGWATPQLHRSITTLVLVQCVVAYVAFRERDRFDPRGLASRFR